VLALEFIGAFVLIVGGAVGFTNAVEWLGQRLQLGEGAVGALLAAVGTALPESVIPIVALISGGGGEEACRSRSAPSSARRSCSGRSRCS
jgi:cation:H+ antiporter